jgi:hypothetical protein
MKSGSDETAVSEQVQWAHVVTKLTGNKCWIKEYGIHLYTAVIVTVKYSISKEPPEQTPVADQYFVQGVNKVRLNLCQLQPDAHLI